MADEERYAQNGGLIPQDTPASQGPSVRTPVTRPPETTLNVGAGPVSSLARGNQGILDGSLPGTTTGARPGAVSMLSASQALAPGMTAVVTGVADEVSQQLRGGNYGAAAGQALRGALALPVAAADDAIGRPLRAVGGPVSQMAAGAGNALYTAATGNNDRLLGNPAAAATLPPAPATAPPTSAPAPATRTDAQRGGAAGSAAPAVSLTPAAPKTPDTAAAPPTGGGGGGSIVKSMRNADGSAGKTYAWGGPVATMAARGAKPLSDLGAGSELVTTSDGVTTSVAQLQAQQAREAADPTAAAARSQLAFQQAAIQNARDAANAAGGGRKAWMANFNASLDAAGVPNFLGSADSAQRLKLDAKNAGVANAKAGTENKLAVQTLNAKMAYAAALESGDAAKIAKAADRLRAMQGKYEKENPPVRKLVVPGGQQVIDGQTVTQPSSVYDPDTDRWITPPKAGGGAPAKNIATDSAALAIRNDKTLSRDDKVKRLQAMGYQ